ncbi:WecB/TagA/CpsF family glycosyltransferase [Paenarthrobacter sp. NPDC089714]|uniref:WecB/TagA/CpsF family glycosyltransferase n=1 Tax=Paenarthrobacter sp. NPDC089714 TaxID=3364377 RepID=UPI00380B051F
MLQSKTFPIGGLFHDLAGRLSYHPPAAPQAAQAKELCLGGSSVRLMEFPEAVRFIMDRATHLGTPPLGVCSANLDHIRHFGTGSRWAGTMAGPAVEWLTLIDGAPLAVEAERLTGKPWPRLAGSDLVGPLLDEAERRGLRVGFLGGSGQAQQLIRQRFAADRPGLAIAGWWAPDRSEISDPEASRRLAGEIAASDADLLVVGLGKPRQELWITEYGHLTGAKVLLAFGAVVDFLAGRITRAPAWVAGHGFEWAWRLMLEPRRLAHRYLVDGPEAYLHLRRDSGLSAASGMTRAVGQPAHAPLQAPGTFASAEDQADIAVVVVTYNNADDIGPLIESLRAETATQTLKVVVADNSPNGDTMAALADHPDVIAKSTGGNLGYAGGINVGLRAAGPAGAFLILNPDLRVERGAVAALRRRMAASGAGAVVPVLLDDDGSVYPSLRREPSILRALGDAAMGSRLPGRPGWLSEMDFDAESYKYAHAVEWATGAALLIDARVAEAVGEWDEQFFLYSEETDFCRRVRELGFPIWFEPSARMWHERGGSGSSAQLSALMSVNRVRYAEKHLGRGRSGAFRLAVLGSEIARLGKPGHREAAVALLSRRRWASLPHAGAYPEPGPVVRPVGSVVIPAHNEAAVIGRTLDSLREVLAWGTVEVIVACNGCSDGTEAIAAAYDGVRVIEVEAASKVAALNAADEAAQLWPRLYLDADIEVTAGALSAVFSALTEGSLLAGRPAYRYDTTGATFLVRAYYRARTRIPGNSEGLWGAGAYALSEAGHARLGTFPPLSGDDYYVDRLFTAEEKAVLDTEPVVVRTPRSPSALMAVLRRTSRGNAQQDAVSGDASASRTLRQLVESVRGPLTAFDALVYAAFAGAGRRRALRPGTPALAWERDNSSR